MNPSRTRQRIHNLYGRLGKRMEVVLGRTPVFAGSLYRHRTRCGKPGCKCAETDYRHESWCVSFTEADASRTRVIPKGYKAEVEKMTRQYHRYRRARREIREIFEELMAEVDALGEKRCEEGSERFERLLSEAKGGK